VQPIDDTTDRTGDATPDAAVARLQDAAQHRAEHQPGTAEPHAYVAVIEWNVEGASPREAAEEMWDNVRHSEGPMVELTEQDGHRIRVLVDLEREPGDDDVTVLSPPPEGVLITRQQLDKWAGRHLRDDELDRLRKALPHSSLRDTVATIVGEFATASDSESEPHAHRN